MSAHQAVFASLGYLYQLRYALYRAIEDSDAYFITLESLDDVAIEKSSSTELLQLKHHFADTNLTNKSVDFWKSIGIWAGQIIDEELDTEEFKFYLITTSKVKEKAIASYLMIDKRDVKTAIELMDQAASEIKNSELKKSIKNYEKLSSTQKLQLCNSITILSNEENISELKIKITKRLELTVQTDFVDDLYEKLEGWWFGKAVDQLFGNVEKIWRDEVRDKILQLSYEYHPESLPVDFSDADLEAHEFEGFMDYQFVTQLELIGVSTRRIQQAILDYYKAYHQRTKWIRDDLLIEYDISDYERRLIDSWGRFKLSVIDELADADEDELKKAGRAILNWVQNNADIRIKPRVSERFVMVGSYHMLADGNPAKIGWHPNFENELAKLLEV